jgi:hypothetical protein
MTQKKKMVSVGVTPFESGATLDSYDPVYKCSLVPCCSSSSCENLFNNNGDLLNVPLNLVNSYFLKNINFFIL